MCVVTPCPILVFSTTKRHSPDLDDTGVADLAALLAVERRAVEDDVAGLPGLQPRDPLRPRDDSEHDGVGLVVIVADELGGGPLLGDLGYGTAVTCSTSRP